MRKIWEWIKDFFRPDEPYCSCEDCVERAWWKAIK